MEKENEKREGEGEREREIGLRTRAGNSTLRRVVFGGMKHKDSYNCRAPQRARSRATVRNYFSFDPDSDENGQSYFSSSLPWKSPQLKLEVNTPLRVTRLPSISGFRFGFESCTNSVENETNFFSPPGNEYSGDQDPDTTPGLFVPRFILASQFLRLCTKIVALARRTFANNKDASLEKGFLPRKRAKK